MEPGPSVLSHSLMKCTDHTHINFCTTLSSLFHSVNESAPMVHLILIGVKCNLVITFVYLNELTVLSVI